MNSCGRLSTRPLIHQAPSNRPWSWVAACLLLGATACRPAAPSANASPESTASAAVASEATASQAASSQATVSQPAALTPRRPALAETTRQAVTAFCGDCHTMPRADFFPRSAWPDEIQLGYDRYFESRRTDLKVPVMADVLRYFQEAAPVTLPLPPSKAASKRFVREFREFRELADDTSTTKTVETSAAVGSAPAIANVVKLPLFADSPAVWVTCDMRDGGVRWTESPDRLGRDGQLLARLRNPCRASAADWDGDGRQDLLIADLGSFDPADHDQGRVVWLRPGEDRAAWVPIVLAEGLGRVADARAADLDADGDLDLIVAEFGWRKSGRLFWLENAGGDPLRPVLMAHELDHRAGAIDAIPVDFNGDGRVDIVTVMSQHYEEVIVHINEGGGRFTPRVISRAHDPAFGSSGIELADLDRDGDLDVVYSNGDTFDSKLVKPYHGVQWLENRGEFPFVEHRIADLAGAYKAVTGDLDRDGDLDIVAGAFLPRQLLGNTDLRSLDSLIVLEQTAPGKFERHRVLAGDFAYASLALDDLNADGFPEIILGVFQLRDKDAHRPAFRVLRNVASND